MKGHVLLGSTRSFELKTAVLVYDEGERCFASVHEVVPSRSGGPPTLAPGRALGSAFLNGLTESLDGASRAEVLPPDVLARTPRMICWWTPATMRPMFFRTNDTGLARLNRRLYPHPALVFKVQDHTLFVRALECDERPSAATNLMVAPYWNTYPTGGVCLGSMRVPRDLSLETYTGWEQGFFSSAFTHAVTAGKLTRHPEGFLAMWGELADRCTFPPKYLQPSEERLIDFVERGGG